LVAQAANTATVSEVRTRTIGACCARDGSDETAVRERFHSCPTKGGLVRSSALLPQKLRETFTANEFPLLRFTQPIKHFVDE
jgi:hypothetical protein